MSSWVSLVNHSQYSVLNASISVKAIAKRARECHMAALALTDLGNMFGAVEFFKACQSEGIKPIIGLEIALAPTSRLEKKKTYGLQNGYPLVLLAKNKKGYQNLCKLTSIGFLEGFYYTPRVDREILAQHAEGLICLTGQMRSRLASALLESDEKESLAELTFLKELFKDDLYLQLQRHQMSEAHISLDGMDQESWLIRKHRDFIKKQATLNNSLLKLELPVVATNATRYLNREDWRAHEILMNVQSGEPCEIWERDTHGRVLRRIPNPKRHTLNSHEYYFKNSEEMTTLFSDQPQAIENSLKIAEKCSFEMNFKARFYPVFVPPHLEGRTFTAQEREKASEDYLKTLCLEGIEKRYTQEALEEVRNKYPDKDPGVVVKERLDYELNVILSKGMCDYLLIVRDFISWAKSHDIPVGPGRGSGAGSIILYLIGVTDIEPLRFSLFFERFINPERLSYPDIDVDICMERRSKVIDYTIQKYGKDKVAQIITFGTMKAKMAIKDVGRVLSVPLAKVNEIAKLVPEDPNMTLEKAFEMDKDLLKFYESDEDAKRIIDIAKILEGSIRNTGIHAAGLIVSADPLTDHIPVCTAKDADMVVTQYAMKPVESVGMLKIDFLGLKTLTSIQKTVRALEKKGEVSLDVVNLPLNDANTFDLLNQGKTLGVFQLESGGMQDLARQLHIDKFEEIIAVGALYRPGPMEMIPTFINRKHKREPIVYDHPWMEEILKETYGIMVYQEQVMQIAQKLAGYSLGEGDLLRKAMGKKDHEEMQRQRKKFLKGAIEKGLDEGLAGEIFSNVEKFASYGFNKAHATAYGFLSYVTAYLKANHPKEWMAALMTCDIDDISRVSKHIREAESMAIPILSPDVNESGDEFVATNEGIRFAMSGIKGVGHGVVEAIIEEREKEGNFSSLYDFLKRIDLKRAGKKAILHLIDAGGFDFSNWTRSQLRSELEPMYEQAMREQKEKAKGVIDLFASLENENSSPFLLPPENVEESSKQERLSREKELLGFYLTGHPMDEYQEYLTKLSCVPFTHLRQADHGAVFRAAFIVDTITVRISQRSQRKFAILIISNGHEHFELPIWSDLYEIKNHILHENQLLYAVVQVDKREGDFRLHCRWLDDLTKMDEEMIQASDKAYEQAKTMEIRESKRPKEVKNKEEKISMTSKKTIHIHIDADEIKLSHIVKIKKILQDYPGQSPLFLHFVSQEGAIGKIEIDSDWGVAWSDEIEEKIQSLTCFKRLEVAK
ncbi:MAG: DNA polymerase III subunit alpha [Simkaniaceae bacterium]